MPILISIGWKGNAEMNNAIVGKISGMNVVKVSRSELQNMKIKNRYMSMADPIVAKFYIRGHGYFLKHHKRICRREDYKRPVLHYGVKL